MSDEVRCDICGKIIEGDDWHLVSQGQTVATACDDCYCEGPPEPRAWALREREV